MNNQPIKSVIYKHDPILFEGKPILNHCLWNFELDPATMKMRCTSDHKIQIEWNPDTFEEILDRTKVQRAPYNSEIAASVDKLWVIGKDVDDGSEQTLMLYCYIPIKFTRNKLQILKKRYKDYKYYKHQYEYSKQALNSCINTIDPKEIPGDMTVQDYIDLVLDPDIDGTEH